MQSDHKTLRNALILNVVENETEHSWFVREIILLQEKKREDRLETSNLTDEVFMEVKILEAFKNLK